MIAAAARQLAPPSSATSRTLSLRELQRPSACPHQPQLVGSSTKMLLASSEAHLPQWNCLRRLGDPNSVGSGSAAVSAAFSNGRRAPGRCRNLQVRHDPRKNKNIAPNLPNMDDLRQSS